MLRAGLVGNIEQSDWPLCALPVPCTTGHKQNIALFANKGEFFFVLFQDDCCLSFHNQQKFIMRMFFPRGRAFKPNHADIVLAERKQRCHAFCCEVICLLIEMQNRECGGNLFKIIMKHSEVFLS